MAKAEQAYHKRDLYSDATGLNAAVMTIARYLAREAVKQELRSKGIKLLQVESCEISRAAIVYLDNHPELIDFATARYWDCVKRGVIKLPRNRRKQSQ